MLLDQEDREILIKMQWFFWGIHVDQKPCQASEESIKWKHGKHGLFKCVAESRDINS